MYSFYFGSLLLPVTPQKLTTKIKGNNKTLTLVNEGDINFLRSPGLTEISFDVVLPIPAIFAELATATGFYYSKAKAENRIKLRKKYGPDIYNDSKED